MENTLIVVGLNHKTAPVEVREKFSFTPKRILEANRLLKETSALEENLVLSTCNRVEIYAVADDIRQPAGQIKNFLGRFHHLDLADYEKFLYVHRGVDAVKHLFGVAAGLDSLVIGEMEILGQVKKAYQDAQACSSTGKVLNRLFEKALNTSKRIRTETFVSRGVVSVGSAAVRLAQKILGDLADKTVLIVGAGAIGEQLVTYLRKNGIKSILVANRTLEKAQALAERFCAMAVAYDEFRGRLVDVDIVLASTGAPHCIIRRDDIVSLMPKRKQRPLFLIDLAVPRDVEDEVNRLDNVYLYNIDDLEKIVDENMSLRKGELDNCSRIIEDASLRFMDWLTKERSRHDD